MGGAGAHGGGRSQTSFGCPWHRIPSAQPGGRWPLGRGALHRHGFPAGLLSALSRLCEVLSALGARAVSQSDQRQYPGCAPRPLSPTATRPGRIVVVTGLAREARIAASPAVHTLVGGGDEAALSAGLTRAVAQGAQAIISFGIAGGLDTTLAPGACLLGSPVSVGLVLLCTDVIWNKRLLAVLPRLGIAQIARCGLPEALRRT